MLCFIHCFIEVFVLSTNDNQSKKLDELLRHFLSKDAAGDCWYLKQIFFVPSSKDPTQFEKITIVLIDKKENILFRSIDSKGDIK